VNALAQRESHRDRRRKIEITMKTLGNALTIASIALLTTATSWSNAQTSAPPKKPEPARAEVPDGSPALPRDTTINQTTATTLVRERVEVAPEATSDVASSEERVESRLAVIRSGRATVTDPNVGRYDRAVASGNKRVTPTMWELFRF
jgi:hypothetical protein